MATLLLSITAVQVTLFFAVSRNRATLKMMFWEAALLGSLGLALPFFPGAVAGLSVAVAALCTLFLAGAFKVREPLRALPGNAPLVLLSLLAPMDPVMTLVTLGHEDWREAIVTSDSARVADPLLFWKSKPEPPYNALGYRGPLPKDSVPPGAVRIVAYGDSNTDGPATNEGWTDDLRRLASEDSRWAGSELINAGVAGYSSFQGLASFRESAPKLRPDIILVSFGWNDPPPPIGPEDKDFAAPSGVHLALERKLLDYQLYLLLRRLASSRSGTPSDLGRHRVEIADYVTNLESFFSEARSKGIEPVFLTRPHLLASAEMERQPTWRRFVPAYNVALRKWAEKAHARVLDVESHFERLGPSYFADECHFNERGHREMAKLVFGELKKIPRFERRLHDVAASAAGRPGIFR